MKIHTHHFHSQETLEAAKKIVCEEYEASALVWNDCSMTVEASREIHHRIGDLPDQPIGAVVLETIDRGVV